MQKINGEIYSESLFIARLDLPGKYDLTKSGISLPVGSKSPDVLSYQSEIFKSTWSPDGTLWLPDSYLSNQSSHTKELPKIVDLAEKREGRFGLGRLARVAAALAVSALSTAGILLYGDNSASAISPATKTGAERCAVLQAAWFPSLDIRNAALDIVIAAFPDQQAGKSAYLTDPMYQNNLNTILTEVQAKAKSEMGMNLTINRPFPVIDMPNNFSSYRNQGGGSLLLNDLAAASPPKSAGSGELRTGKTYINLTKPDSEPSDNGPEPGSLTRLGYYSTTSIVGSYNLTNTFIESGKWIFMHESVMHGIANVGDHENEQQNTANINPRSVLLQNIPSFPFSEAVVTDFNLQEVCINGITPTPTKTSTPGIPTPGKYRVNIPLGLRGTTFSSR